MMKYVLLSSAILIGIVNCVTYSCTMSNCNSCEDHGLECTGCSNGYLLKADQSGCSGWFPRSYIINRY